MTCKECGLETGHDFQHARATNCLAESRKQAQERARPMAPVAEMDPDAGVRAAVLAEIDRQAKIKREKSEMT